MNTIRNVLLLSMLALAVSSCGRGYNMHHSGYGYAPVYERPLYPAVYVGTPYLAYSQSSYVGANSNHYYGGGMGGGMH